MTSSTSPEPSRSEDIVYALASSTGFDSSGSGICFAARGSGLYRSSDGGRTWEFSFESLGLDQPLPALAVALSPGFDEDRRLFAGVPGGVLSSSDAGDTWQVFRFPAPPPVVSALAISPVFARDGILFAGTTEDGIFLTSDEGSHWTSWNFGLLDLHVLCLAVSPNFEEDETVFAGTDSGIFRSTNGGRAWREVHMPFEFDPVLSLAVSSDYAQDATLFAGAETQGLLVSSDRGLTWSRVGQPDVEGPVNAVLLSPGFPSEPHLLILHGDRLMVSYDFAKSWSPWREHPELQPGVTAVLAPSGFQPGAPALAALSNGRILPL